MPSKLPFFPEQASSFAGDVDALTLWLIGMSAFFTLLIAGLVVIFALRFRRRSPDQVGTKFDESPLLEITWTVIPLLIVLFTFAWGAKVYFRLYRAPAGAAEFHVTGKQWMWKTQHPTGQREINELHLPVGEPAKLLLTSEDVIHSFFIPAFRVKTDVVPGRFTTMWFTPTRTGRYHLFCTEYCGTEHSRMIGWVTVQEPEAYQDWLASVPVPATLRERGEQVFARLGCGECHGGAGGRGPALEGIAGREVELAAGARVRADENYLRESIVDPGAKVVAGFLPLMPSFRGQVDEEEIGALISYLKSLPEPTTAAAAAASESVIR